MRFRLRHQRLAELLATSPLSQNHWALKLGLSRGHWSEIVNGKHPYPSAKTRARLLEVFDLPAEALFDAEVGVAQEGGVDFRRAIADRFLIDAELGQGGMGAVYLARDVRHGRTVAVKIISTESVSGIGLDQFHREIATVARLQHPNVLPLFDSGDAAGHPFYAMPWVREGSLRGRLRARLRLNATDAAVLLTGIGRALHHAHGEHVLHCDIKPENVLLFGDHPYVMDFGIARKIHSEIADWPLRNELDVSAGTPAYVSPEQASGARDLDARSDVYSLGCMAFELLTGRPPFEGTTTQAIVSRRFIVPPPPVRAFAPDVPAGIQGVLERALSVPRDQRQPSATAFAEEFAQAADARRRLFSGASLAASRIATTVVRRVAPRHRGISVGLLPGIFGDIALAWRGVRRAPAFALVVALTLGLAVGANATMFGIVDRLWLRAPAHIAAPDQVRRVQVANWVDRALRRPSTSMTYPGFTSIRDNGTVFRQVAAVVHTTLSLDAGTEARSLAAELVTGDYFALLGVPRLRGRLIAADDDRLPSGQPVVVLSDRLWRERYDASDSAIGRSMLLNGTPFRIIGVAPRDFTGPDLAAVDVWIPLSAAARPILHLPADWPAAKGWMFLQTFARVRDGVTDAMANADARRAYHEGHSGDDEYTAKAVASLAPLILAHDTTRHATEPQVALWLLGMTVIVLLIACANVANLVLARTLGRRGEFAIRRALGVSQGRLARQLVAESLVLAALGGLVGVALARWGGEYLRRNLLPGVTWDSSPVSGRVLAITAVATLVSAAMSGLLPLMGGARADLGATMRGASRGLAGGHRRALTSLLVVQTTLTMALLIGAGLFLRSLHAVRSLPLGFAPQQALYAVITPPASAAAAADLLRLYRDAAARVRALPGVTQAGIAIGAPFMASYGAEVRVPGRDTMPQLPGGGPYFFRVGAGAMEAMGIHPLRGRLIDDRDDREGAAPVVVITERMAHELWPSEDPLTRCLIIFDGPCAPVVGVIADLHRQQITEEPFLQFFMALAASPDHEVPRALMVRVTGSPEASVESVRRAIVGMRPDMPYVRVQPYEALIDPQARSWTLGASMFTLFGVISLVMASIGVYGVLSYMVSQRTREMGIRVALGAPPGRVLRSVVVHGVLTAAAGIAIGAGVAFLAADRVQPLLFQTSARELTTYALAGVALLAAATAAVLAPALRAARTDPMTALRAE